MNTSEDVDRLLSKADPAAGWDPSPADQERAIAEALDAIPRRHPFRSFRRPAVAATVCVLAILGFGGAAVASNFVSAPAQQAFSPDRAGAPDRQSLPLIDQAVLQVTGEGPDGGTVSLWSAPLDDGAGGTCSAIVGSAVGASYDGKPFMESASCTQGGTTAATFSKGQGSRWVSPETGAVYWRFGGVVGDAVKVQLRVPGQPYKNLSVGNGWYVGSVPLREFKRGTLVAYNAAGERLASQRAWI